MSSTDADPPPPSVHGWPRNLIPTRNKDLTTDHAAQMLSAENPGAPITLRDKLEKKESIAKLRKSLQQYLRGKLGTAIGIKAGELGLKTKEGVLVTNIDQVRKAFRKCARDSALEKHLIKMQLSLHEAMKGDRDDIKLQESYMRAKGVFFLGKNGDRGDAKTGGCISQLANEIKNDILRTLRDIMYEKADWKVVLRKPNEEEKEKNTISVIGKEAFLLRKIKDEATESSYETFLSLDVRPPNVNDRIKSLENEIARLQLLSVNGMGLCYFIGTFILCLLSNTLLFGACILRQALWNARSWLIRCLSMTMKSPLRQRDLLLRFWMRDQVVSVSTAL